MPTRDHKVIWLNMTPEEREHLETIIDALTVPGGARLTLTNLMRDALSSYCEEMGFPREFPHSIPGKPRAGRGQ